MTSRIQPIFRAAHTAGPADVPSTSKRILAAYRARFRELPASQHVAPSQLTLTRRLAGAATVLAEIECHALVEWAIGESLYRHGVHCTVAGEWAVFPGNSGCSRALPKSTSFF